MAALADVEAKCPRIASRQQHRSNTPATIPEAYYRVNLAIPLLQHVIAQLDEKFSGTFKKQHKETNASIQNYCPLFLTMCSMPLSIP